MRQAKPGAVATTAHMPRQQLRYRDFILKENNAGKCAWVHRDFGTQPDDKRFGTAETMWDAMDQVDKHYTTSGCITFS